MRPARRRGVRALAGTAVAAGLALFPLVVAMPAGASAADITTTINPVQVTVDSISPLAPQPGDTLVVSGTLRNTTDATVSGLDYQLKLGTTPISSRGAFDAYGDDQDGDVSALYPVSSTLSAATRPELPAGQSEPYRISVPVSTLSGPFGLGSSWQVREMGVSVTSFQTPVGHVRTYLPWAPRTTAETPLGVAWILPLTDRPHRTTSSEWFDDALAAELSPDQRLGVLVAAGTTAEDQTGAGSSPRISSVPITWAVDPMLVNDAKAMTAPSGYKVTTTSGTRAGTGASAAKAFLPALHGAVSRPDASVFALPYGDPDMVAAVRAKLTAAIGLAAASGRTMVQQILGVTPAANYGWPPGGYADERTVNALTAIGDNPIILSDAALPAAATTSYTPNAATSLVSSSGPLPALVTDSGLTDDVVGGNSAGVINPDGARLSVQRYLAETLMIHAELPGASGRNVIVAPGRHWAPSLDYATTVLADTGKVPWISPVSLSAVAHSAPDTTVARRGLNYPASARNNELSQTYLDQVRRLRTRISDFATILPSGNAEVRDLTTAVQQAMSAGWRGNHAIAVTALNRLSGDVDKATNQVKVASHPNSYITLTSHGGKVPVTIENDLATPVRIMVKLNSNHRLELPNNGRVIQTLPAHQLTRVDFRATANTSGVFQVHVQLLTPDGRHRYGDAVALYVKSTVYGTITLVITGAATGALLIAVVVRLTRRALAARRSAAPVSL